MTLAAEPTAAPTPDLAAIKARQQATWASGDYHVIGTQIVIGRELLIEAMDVHAPSTSWTSRPGTAMPPWPRPGGLRRHWPRLRAGPARRARQRAEAEGVAADFVLGDAEALPFEDAASTRSFGLRRDVHARPGARGRRAARVCRPGGRIGLVADPRRVHRSAVQDHRRPCAAAGRPSLADHGAPRRGCASCSATGLTELRLVQRQYSFRERSPRAFIDHWRRFYGPTLKAFETVGEAGREALETDLLALIARFNRATDGTMVVPSDYSSKPSSSRADHAAPGGGGRQLGGRLAARPTKRRGTGRRRPPAPDEVDVVVGHARQDGHPVSVIPAPSQPASRWPPPRSPKNSTACDGGRPSASPLMSITGIDSRGISTDQS